MLRETAFSREEAPRGLGTRTPVASALILAALVIRPSRGARPQPRGVSSQLLGRQRTVPLARPGSLGATRLARRLALLVPTAPSSRALPPQTTPRSKATGRPSSSCPTTTSAAFDIRSVAAATGIRSAPQAGVGVMRLSLRLQPHISCGVALGAGLRVGPPSVPRQLRPDLRPPRGVGPSIPGRCSGHRHPAEEAVGVSLLPTLLARPSGALFIEVRDVRTHLHRTPAGLGLELCHRGLEVLRAAPQRRLESQPSAARAREAPNRSRLPSQRRGRPGTAPVAAGTAAGAPRLGICRRLSAT